MRKVSKILLLGLLCSATFAQAQNKYAVLIGINDYYSSPEIKHPSSLHGCVNDALSLQELLLNRFGFAKANIYTLFDSAATRPAVLNLMHQVLRKASSGDAFVFYYSGHGVWMNNPFQLDSVKRKMSQAMAMSNLYAPSLGCLLTDEDLKTVFNQFVDKKVIATALLDCCYSGKMMALPRSDYWVALPRQTDDKSIPLDQISYTTDLIEPKGCPVDSTENSTPDTDGDGVPDCRDWELQTLPGRQVDSFGIEKLSAEDYILQTTTDPRFIGYSTDSAVAIMQERAFNLKDDLTVSFLPRAKRPADREGSGFLSLAASTEYQKAAEITDETGTKHGAFTKALLTVYTTNPSSLPVSELMAKISAALKQQHYNQDPAYLFEKSRLTRNLTGLGSTGLANGLTVNCTAVTNGRLTLDKGLYAGLSKGNVLKSIAGTKTIIVDSVTATESMALDNSHKAKKGDVFQLIDGFTYTAPLVKLYIPEMPFSPDEFSSFLKNEIEPLTAYEFYADYNFIARNKANTVLAYVNKNQVVQYQNQGSEPTETPYSIVLLPLPSYIIGPLKKLVAKNQNIQLVASANEADYVLCLNYAKAREKNPAGFAFYYHPPLQNDGVAIFSYERLEVPTLALGAVALASLTQKLVDLTGSTPRYKTHDVWLNGKAKK